MEYIVVLIAARRHFMEIIFIAGKIRLHTKTVMESMAEPGILMTEAERSIQVIDRIFTEGHIQGSPCQTGVALTMMIGKTEIEIIFFAAGISQVMLAAQADTSTLARARNIEWIAFGQIAELGIRKTGADGHGIGRLGQIEPVADSPLTDIAGMIQRADDRSSERIPTPCQIPVDISHCAAPVTRVGIAVIRKPYTRRNMLARS